MKPHHAICKLIFKNRLIKACLKKIILTKRFPTPYAKADNISWLYTALAREWTQTGLPSYLSANISQ